MRSSHATSSCGSRRVGVGRVCANATTPEIAMSSTVTGAASRTQAQSPAPALVPNLARALGWFSVGVGVAEMLAPRTLGNFIGIRGQVGLLRGLGFREVAHGVA